MAEGSGGVGFLQGQAQRMNDQLRQHHYKAQPPPLAVNGQAVSPSSESQQAGLLTDKSLLNPLLTEYDNIIAQLQQKVSTYQAEFAALNTRVEEVTAENARLHQQLCESVESQLAKEGKEEGEREGLKRSTTALQNQLSHISKEKDEYREKCRQMTFELEHLQKSDREKSRCLEKYKTELATAEHNVLALQQKMEELQTACVKLNEEYNRSVETARSGGQEVEELTQALSDTRVQCKALQLKNSELVRAHNELTQQLRKQEAERQVFDGHGRVIDGRVHLLELANTELEAKLVAALSDVSVLNKEKAELEESITLHQSRLAGLEREVHQAVAHVKESMDMVESAILNKDQAVIVSEQKTQEVERLRAAMEALLQEVGHRTRREVEAVRADYNRNIDRMAVEIQKLEEECGQKQALLERTQREKKAVETDLERVREKLPAEAAKSGEALQRLQTRMHEAEQAAEEACMKRDSALMAQRATETRLSEEKSHHEEMCGELRRRVREGEEESGRGREERAKLARQLRELTEQLSREREAREEVERKTKQEVAVVRQGWELRERELQQRLQTREQSHSKSIEELREMLNSQFRVTTRWKEESNNMTHQFEETIKSLRNEVANYRKRLEATKFEMDTLSKQKEQRSRQVAKLQSRQVGLQIQARESDSRAEATAAQVSSLLLREKQLLAEKRDLQRQLDKLKLEITRRAGLIMGAPVVPSLPHTLPDPLHLSNQLTTHPLTSSAVPGGRGWEEALSGLRETIRRARRDMEDTRHTHATSAASLICPHSDVGDGERESSPESSTVISQHSPLHRTDLSDSLHT